MTKKQITLIGGLIVAGAAAANASQAAYRPVPGLLDCGPVPAVVVYCEDGTPARFDWETCKFRCGGRRPKPWIDPAPRPEIYRQDSKFGENLQGLEAGVSDLKDAVGGGNIGAANNQLGAFYSGGTSLGSVSAADAVRVPRWRAEMNETVLEARVVEKEKEIFNPPPPSPKPGESAEPFRVASAGTIIRGVGKVIVESGAAEAAKEAARKANKAAEDYVNRDRTQDMIDKYGGKRMDHLKSKNK
jgi:hypothetical protein